MDRLNFLEELLIMVRTGEINHPDGREDAERTLLEIRDMVQTALKEEVFQDITDRDTVFYAPEHESWKDFLIDCNGYADYAKAVDGYTEKELEELWEASHLADRMDEEQLRKKIFREIANLKMREILVRKKYVPENLEECQQRVRESKAKIKGFYNILYEN